MGRKAIKRTDLYTTTTKLPAKTIRQQIELQKEQHLQLRHSILQDTVQTEVVLPQDHTRLERTAPGGCDSRVTGLF